MAQFAVYEIAGHGYVVDCQTDLLADLRSRFVIPLRSREDLPPSQGRLNPTVEVAHRTLVLATQFARAVDIRDLGDCIGSLANHRDQIIGAIDMLLTGY